MKNTLITLSFLASFSLLGCDGGGDTNKAAEASEAAAKPGSCLEGGKTGSTCSEYTAEGAKDGKSYCEKTGGGKNVWTDDKCPAENKIGTCERKRGQSQHYYSTGDDAMDAETAKEMCVTMSEGKWVEPSAAAPKAAPKEAAAAPSCADAAKHVVGLLAPQGDDAMLKEADIPKLTEGCEKAGNLGTDPNAKCILAAKSLEEVDKCGDKGFDGLIKPWLK